MNNIDRRNFMLLGAAAAAAATIVTRPSLALAAGWDDHMARLTGILPDAGLFGHDGLKWAGPATFRPETAVVKSIVAGFTDATSLRASGPTLFGKKYMITRADDKFIFGKKGPAGFGAHKTLKTVVICTFDEEKITPGNVRIAVEKFGVYLHSIGY